MLKVKDLLVKDRFVYIPLIKIKDYDKSEELDFKKEWDLNLEMLNITLKDFGLNLLSEPIDIIPGDKLLDHLNKVYTLEDFNNRVDTIILSYALFNYKFLANNPASGGKTLRASLNVLKEVKDSYDDRLDFRDLATIVANPNDKGREMVHIVKNKNLNNKELDEDIKYLLYDYYWDNSESFKQSKVLREYILKVIEEKDIRWLKLQVL